MNETFEPKNLDEVKQALKFFNSFHDGYVEKIQIKFENYKSIDEKGEAGGIGNADMSINLTVNAYPYGKEHNQVVEVEFMDVNSYEIVSERSESFPSWGIFEATVRTAPEPFEDELFWDFALLGDKATFEVTCSKVVFTNLGYIMNKKAV